MIALPANKVVNSVTENEDRREPRWSITCLSRSGFELVELGIVLTGELAFRGLAIEFGSRAIVESRVCIDPDLCVGIPLIFWSFRSLGQSKIDQEFVEHGEICICRHPSPGRAPGGCGSTAGRAHRVVRLTPK